MDGPWLSHTQTKALLGRPLVANLIVGLHRLIIGHVALPTALAERLEPATARGLLVLVARCLATRTTGMGAVQTAKYAAKPAALAPAMEGSWKGG